jgi:hypothetical protein
MSFHFLGGSFSRGGFMMRKTFLMNLTVIAFEAMMMATVITQLEALRLLTMLVLLPIVFLMTTVTKDCHNKVDFILTMDSLFVLVQGLIWDMAVFRRGIWIYIFASSMVFAFYGAYHCYRARIKK